MTRRQALWMAGAGARAAAEEMRFGDSSRRGVPFAKDPSVVHFRGRYLMYYSIPAHGDGRANDGWAMGVAESMDLLGWRKVGEITPQQPYEAQGICAGGAVVLDGRLHLFYQTYGNRERDAICHAVSDDGLRFARNAGNPIWRPRGEWTCGRAIDADAIPFAGRLYLYAATRDPAFETQMATGAWARLDSGFAPASWHQLAGRPLLQPELAWERKCIEAPSLLRRKGLLYMFYAGGYNNEPQQVGCAVSRDGVDWRRISDEPLLANGPAGSWNESESGHPCIFTDRGGQTWLFFQGNNDRGKTWRISAVRVEWKAGVGGDVPAISRQRR